MTTVNSLPAPRVPDPMDAPPLRWGIMGTGGIAAKFTHALKSFSRQDVLAVGSRTDANAQAFAGRFELSRAYGSYDALLADPDVQAVYVASPHSGHHELASAALRAGKHVLVEKAFTQDAGQAADLVQTARANGLALMEAMWTRFLPRTDIVRQLLEDGALGDLRVVIADHGQNLPHVPRLREPALAGGALLDLAIYPVSFACFALGLPTRIVGTGVLGPTGVDERVAISLDGFAEHPSAQASLHTTMAAKTPTTATICGTSARVELDGDFYAPGSVRVVTPEGEATTSASPKIVGHQALVFEGAHFAQLVADGRTESPWLPLDETLAIMRIMDELRAQVGTVYPGEKL